MTLDWTHRAALLAAMVAFWTAGDATARADGIRQPRPRDDLFYNFYAGPSAIGGNPAQLYLSPIPTPPLVGHTYITYQPLMPHEFLYKHHRTYRRWDPYQGGGTNTHVLWW